MATSSTSSIKLRPADPFDLIRWLARSQSDPRKAIAELVQNSIDANARRVTIERRRVRRLPALAERTFTVVPRHSRVNDSPYPKRLRLVAFHPRGSSSIWRGVENMPPSR